MSGRAGRALVICLTLAVLAGCGGSDEGGPEVGQRAVTIEQILRDPENWNEGAVRVPGRAYPAGGRGFVLRASDSSIWVAAPSGVDGLEAGERVTVEGDVELLTEENVDRVDQALRSPTEPGLPAPPDDVVKQTPAEVGEPFIALRVLSREE